MRTICVIVVACMLALPQALSQAPKEEEQQVRFEAVHVYVDVKDAALAAYQVEFAAETGNVKIAGIEGGEHHAFKKPPYYDLAAMQKERVVIAAFNTGRDLPRGKTRVATIHVQVTGEAAPRYVAKLVVAATADGKEIEGTVTLRGEAKQ